MKNCAEKIIAIEPGKENFSALLANLKINAITNVVAIQAAANDKSEEIFLDGENSNLFVTENKTGNSVRGVSLDLLLQELHVKYVDIMKVDVQGHEKSVISGLHNLLNGKFVKLLIIEVHLKRGVSIEDIMSQMKQYDYRLIYKDDFLYEQPHLYFESKRFLN